MGDVEFQMALAPNLGYVGDIDPSVARYHGLGGADGEYNVKGLYRLPLAGGETGRKRGLKFEGEEIPIDYDTVNTFGAKAANPVTWSHEYRHRMHPGLTEKGNRLADAANAQNADQWEKTITTWRDQLWREQDTRPSRDAAEKNLLWNLDRRGYGKEKARHSYNTQYDRGARPSSPSWFGSDKNRYANEQTARSYWLRRRDQRDDD